MYQECVSISITELRREELVVQGNLGNPGVGKDSAMVLVP